MPSHPMGRVQTYLSFHLHTLALPSLYMPRSHSEEKAGYVTSLTQRTYEVLADHAHIQEGPSFLKKTPSLQIKSCLKKFQCIDQSRILWLSTCNHSNTDIFVFILLYR